MGNKKIFISIAVLTCILSACRYDVQPNETCDTSNVTYSNTITSIINAYGCTSSSCHGGNNPQAGIRLTDYAGVKAKIDDGRLWGAINHQSGFIPMPENAGKMSQCDINKIKVWIDAGAPNN